MSLEYFGKRNKRKSLGIPSFGIFLQHEGKWRAALFNSITAQFEEYQSSSVGELWKFLTKYGTPPLWYSGHISEFFHEFVEDVVDEEWLLERVPKNKDGEDIEKMTMISTSESQILRLVFREEKKRKLSNKKDTLTVLSILNYYKDGPLALSKDFATHITKENLPINVWCGMFDIHRFAIEDLGVPLGLSFAGAVLNSLQTHYTNIKVPKLNEALEDFIQPAFFGGKVEVYRIYQEHANCYDKDGLYNEAGTYPLPVKGVYVKKDIAPEELAEMEDLGYVDVDIHIPEDLHKGPLPFRGPHGIVCPVGTLRSTKDYPVRYFTPLLLQAVRLHKVQILKINYGVFFKTSFPLLLGWADFTARLKAEAPTKGERALSKLCQNVPHGKFAQSQIRQITHIGKIPKDKRKDPNVSIISDDLPIWFETTKQKLANHLPNLAAAITGWAHVIMLRDFQRVESEGISICYHDTDGLIVDGKLPPDMVGKGISKYKWEHKDVTAICLAPKFYFLLDEKKSITAKAKGFPSYKPAYKDVQNLLQGLRLTVEWKAPPSTVEALVKKFIYQKSEEGFTHSLKERSRTEKRTFPATSRHISSGLDHDTKRKQLDLQTSRPLHISEVLGDTS